MTTNNRLIALVEVAKGLAQQEVKEHQNAKDSVRKQYEDRFHLLCKLLDDLNRDPEKG